MANVPRIRLPCSVSVPPPPHSAGHPLRNPTRPGGVPSALRLAGDVPLRLAGALAPLLLAVLELLLLAFRYLPVGLLEPGRLTPFVPQQPLGRPFQTGIGVLAVPAQHRGQQRL